MSSLRYGEPLWTPQQIAAWETLTRQDLAREWERLEVYTERSVDAARQAYEWFERLEPVPPRASVPGMHTREVKKRF